LPSGVADGLTFLYIPKSYYNPPAPFIFFLNSEQEN
jgi:hypothetical protein